MFRMPVQKYRPFQPVNLPDRRWPSRVIEKAPIWCSVDLRDGNQALPEPMSSARKLRMFRKLVQMGFKEIEVGFPSASQTDFDFVREIIDEHLIPDDVTIQVLTQAREPLIRRTFEAIEGAQRVIIHLYNSTSTLQRRVVFGLPRQGIVDIAVKGTRLIRELSQTVTGTEVFFEYSPESFTGTELEFSVEICSAVMDTWQPTPDRKMIFNLPATVEMATPNVYADQIEWFGRNMKNRHLYLLSLHPHNDRGTGTAAAELGMMAGADRVEGTLFGNGERTGNVDVVNLALNMFTQGVDPGLDVSNIKELVEVAEYCNRLPVHCRHPYAGELVFTAFSGSHQDAIKKGIAARLREPGALWEVPYLPIDPDDIGRRYEPVIRINSQSGKGGIAYVMEQDFGFVLPRQLQVEFSKTVQQVTDDTGAELSPKHIWDIFSREYLDSNQGFRLSSVDFHKQGDSARRVTAEITEGTQTHRIEGSGNGPIDALIAGLRADLQLGCEVLDFHQHSMGKGANAASVAYVELSIDGEGASYGVGRHESILTASILAVLSAINRIRREREPARGRVVPLARPAE
ncbi:MAG TPA: 2-isopropylmalate synthase [Polyangiaceae bacterium]|nr:2-isopropylmalate synthase [Polyangiaceae bacterium]